MFNQSDLLLRIDTFLSSTEMSPATFGRKALGDPNFVFDIRRPKDPRAPNMRTISKVEEFIEKHSKPAKNGARR